MRALFLRSFLKQEVIMENERKNKEKRLEDALLEYIECHAKNAQPGIAETIPAAAMVLVELWKII